MGAEFHSLVNLDGKRPSFSDLLFGHFSRYHVQVFFCLFITIRFRNTPPSISDIKIILERSFAALISVALLCADHRYGMPRYS